jgi:hypothetical protein
MAVDHEQFGMYPCVEPPPIEVVLWTQLVDMCGSDTNSDAAGLGG